MSTPTVRKLQLGHELRRLREAARLTPTDAARAMNCTTAKISRLESGENAISLGDLKLLLELYGDDPEHSKWMVELSKDNRRRRRWTGHWAAVPEWFRTFVDLERDAEDIRIVASEVIPGPLRTEAYMRACSRPARRWTTPRTWTTWCAPGRSASSYSTGTMFPR
jgi:transcriptional regulator with XRE-family HTH domain